MGACPHISQSARWRWVRTGVYSFTSLAERISCSSSSSSLNLKELLNEFHSLFCDVQDCLWS